MEKVSKLCVLNKLENIRQLQALYKSKNENESSLIGFHVLDNFIKWLEKEPNIKYLTFYSLNDEWRQNGLYLIVDRYGLFMNSLKPNDENLRTALKLLDWSRGYKITALPEIHHDIVAATLKELNVAWREVNLQVFRLPWQKALRFHIDCSAAYVLKSLTLDAAPTLDAFFHSQQAGSLLYFQRILTHNLSVGVYLCENDELIAWCSRCPNGFLASLFVKAAYRRRGLAELIVKDFALKLAQLHEPADTFAAANVHNQSSNSLFEKLDFEKVSKICHMYAYCVPSGMEWPYD